MSLERRAENRDGEANRRVGGSFGERTVRFAHLRALWEKNRPEMHAGLTGGLPEFVWARHPEELEGRVPVFCYHVVARDDFENDLVFLKENAYATIDADTLFEHMRQRRRAPRRAVVLTIDDGARNLYDVVFPLLCAYQMKAVAFVATAFHDDDPGPECPSQSEGRSRPLSWLQIREMHGTGLIDFQSHTHQHRYIPRWPECAPLEGSDPEIVRSLRGPLLSVWEDLQLAKETLEQRLSKRVRHLAFPKFYGTEQALRAGHAIGYRAFWWGPLPRRPCNRPGGDPSYIVRLDGRYLRRLPGKGRLRLSRVLRARYHGSSSRLWNALGDRADSSSPQDADLQREATQFP